MIPKDCKQLSEGCDSTPRLQEPIRAPARLDWNEVTKVAHYYLAVNAMTKPLQVREDTPPTRAEAAGLCTLSPDQAYRLLQRLTESARLTRHGTKKGAWYERRA